MKRLYRSFSCCVRWLVYQHRAGVQCPTVGKEDSKFFFGCGRTHAFSSPDVAFADAMGQEIPTQEELQLVRDFQTCVEACAATGRARFCNELDTRTLINWLYEDKEQMERVWRAANGNEEPIYDLLPTSYPVLGRFLEQYGEGEWEVVVMPTTETEKE